MNRLNRKSVAHMTDAEYEEWYARNGGQFRPSDRATERQFESWCLERNIAVRKDRFGEYIGAVQPLWIAWQDGRIQANG